MVGVLPEQQIVHSVKQRGVVHVTDGGFESFLDGCMEVRIACSPNGKTVSNVTKISRGKFFEGLQNNWLEMSKGFLLADHVV